MVTRVDITQSIIDQLPDDQKIPVHQACKTWYKNIRDSGGLRLTEHGYQVLQMLEFNSHTVAVTEDRLSRRSLLELDRRVAFPYYINTKKNHLVLFGSREAMMATLYGDTVKWLNSLPHQRRGQ